jgi:hypothetical protein
LPAYATNDHKYPVAASYSSQVLIPNSDAWRGKYCLKDSLSKASMTHQSKYPALVNTVPEVFY